MWDFIFDTILLADYSYVFWDCWFYWSLAMYTMWSITLYVIYKIEGEVTYSVGMILFIIVLGLLGPISLLISLIFIVRGLLLDYGQGVLDYIAKNRTIKSNSTKLKAELDKTV